ncbi:MAG: dTMP kinase [Phycisphaerales bacterium]
MSGGLFQQGSGSMQSVLNAFRQSASWLPSLAGKFVVFDGPDGSGKSTQFRRIGELARRAGLAVCEVRDPGGTAISERIREVLLDPSLPEMGVRCELMMYMASRAQLVSEKVEPALERGELVLADRYVSSTLAYQGTAGGISKEEIISVARAACGRHWPPTLTVVFDVDQATAATRLNPLLDRMEQKGEAFHKRVRAGYLEQAREMSDRYAVIDATRNQDEVTRATLDAIRAKLVGTEARA